MLKPWIEYAKKVSGKNKVDIVAHSMGGIVARTYIQSDEYQNREDVRRFAMVGTPNQGAPFAYLVWEDGNPIRADEFAISQSNPEGLEFLKFYAKRYFYTNSVINHMEQKWNEKPCSIDNFLYIPSRFNGLPLNCNNKKIKRFVHEHIPSLQELLPTYEGSIKDLDGTYINYSENIALNTLNNQDTDVYNDIKVALFAGINIGTLDNLYVNENGVPVYSTLSPNTSGFSGDGTVPRKSILGDNYNGIIGGINFGFDTVMNPMLAGSHGSLPSTFKGVIKDFIIN